METSNCSVCGKSLVGGASHFRFLVPLFKSENHMKLLVDFLNGINKKIPGGISVNFIVDGRAEDEQAAIENSRNCEFPIRIITLSRNFGVGPALHAGLASGESCVTTAIGSDLQEPEELFLQFFSLIANGSSDVVIGQRKSRQDPIVNKVFSALYWKLNQIFINKEIPLGGFDVFAMSSKVVTQFIKLKELNTNFTSQLMWIGFKVKWISFDRLPRISGKSTWTFRKKLKLFADSFYGYTAKPISFITWASGIISVALLGVIFITFVGHLTGNITVPGYTTLLILISLGHAITIFSLGIIGGYVYRAFENTTGRPNYLVQSEIEINP